MDPKDENNDLAEIEFCCQACFYSDLVESNPIVICDDCEIGVHQKCYGITDLEGAFLCQKCQDIKQDQKNIRLSVDKEQKIRQVIKQINF